MLFSYRTFRIFDDNRSNTLDFEEFSKGMHDYQTDLNDAEIKVLFQKFDTDDSGTVNFNEFLAEVRVSTEE